jgi:hypothetical protein
MNKIELWVLSNKKISVKTYIQLFVDVLKHDEVQAEQCAILLKYGKDVCVKISDEYTIKFCEKKLKNNNLKTLIKEKIC